jgi:predicted transcriptional regulator of viral defense system
MDILRNIGAFSEQPLKTELLLHLLKTYKRPYDKINELVKQGMLLQIKRGLYIPGPNLDLKAPEPFLIANHLYGPSYVSLDAALFYWGLIPERVFEISSVTFKKATKYQTIEGVFSYTSLPLPYYSYGINQVSLTSKQTVLLASPEKALCDKIISTAGLILRSKMQTVTYLIEDLRIEKERLKRLDSEATQTWINESPKKSSIEILVKTINSL